MSSSSAGLSSSTHTSPCEFAHRSHDFYDSGSDSSGKDSPVSPSSDIHLLHHDEPKLNREASTKEKKCPRRVHFDYGISAFPQQDPLAPVFSKIEHSQDIQTAYFRSYISLPWELPSPAHANTTASYRADANDRDCRTESPSFFHSQPFWLLLYFSFNLGLTLYNKAVLIHFPFAYALTALHALCGTFGGFSLLRLGLYVPAKLTDGDNMALLAFSLLYTVNIAVSNLSLELVTIPVRLINGCLLPLFLNKRSSTRSSAQPHQYSPSSFQCFYSVHEVVGKRSPLWFPSLLESALRTSPIRKFI